MKRAVFISVAIICAICLSACGKADEIAPVEEAKTAALANGYFFPQDTDSYAYRVSFTYTDLEPQQEDMEIILYISILMRRKSLRRAFYMN